MVEKKTEDLILEARNFFNSYKKEIGKSARAGKNIIYVDFNNLASFNHELAELLFTQPEEIFQVLEVALEEIGLVKNPRVRLLTLSETYSEKIRNLRAKHLNKLMQVEGIVRQASEVRPQVVNAKFECPSCGTVLSVLQIESKFREPSRCSCGRRGQFRLVSKDMVDAQRVVIEESPESLIGGEQPRRISIFLKEDLVDPKMEERTTPGSRVMIIGILKEIPRLAQAGGILTRYDIAIEANNIIPLEETFEELAIDEEDERQIKELAVDEKVFEKFTESIAPSIYGYEEIKKSLVLQLFGGIKKIRADGTQSRGDIHTLLVGDPGVAKSIGGNEKILYYTEKKQGYQKIKEIYKKFGENPENLNVLTINPENHQAEWCKVEKSIKHKPEKELIKITTEHGKEIIATKDHSFITLSKEGEIVPIKGEKLTENHYLPLPTNFHKEVIDNIKTGNFNTYKTNARQLPEKIYLTKEFGFFIGIFLSEGCIKDEKVVHISNKNKEIKEQILKSAEELNMPANESKEGVSIFSKSLANLIGYHCYDKETKEKINKKIKGFYSRIKKIPEFAYFAPKEFIRGVISGIFLGDGRFIKDKARIKGFELITVSRELAQGTSDLLFSVGILNRVKTQSYIYKNKETEYYILAIPSQMIFQSKENFNFYGREYLDCPKPIYSYHNCIPCGDLVYEVTKKPRYNKRNEGDRTFAAMMRTVRKRNKIGKLRLKKILSLFEKKNQNLKEIDKLKRIVNSLLIWSKIKTIEKIKQQEEVYDLSIPKTNTFVANGIGVHNSVMLKFIAGMAPKGRYIAGRGATGAGLTATVVRDEFLRGWSLEAGAMVLANKGVVCLDEIEKMSPDDRSAMHEGMEQQCMAPDFKLMLSNGKETEIGKFVDNLIEKNKEKVYHGKDCEILPVNNVELISTDFSKHFPTKADRVSRHLAPKEFVKIELSDGKKITVTPEHPCWIVKDGKIITMPAEKLKEEEYFPIASEINIREDDYNIKNDYLCKILGYHLSDGCYELNRGKKTGIQFCNNDEILIKDYKNSIIKFFNLNPGITRGDKQFAVRVISRKVVEFFNKLDKSLLERGESKKIPDRVLSFPKQNIKYLLRALFDGDGTVVNQNRNGCRVGLVLQNRILAEQVSSLLLRFGVSSSIFKDKNVLRLDISGQENLSKFLINISFLSEKKKQRLRQYYEKSKTYRTIRDVIPGCTNKINNIFKKLKISAKKEIGHSIDLNVEKQRIFLQKLILIAEKYALKQKNLKILNEIREIKRIAFGYARWMKIKSVSRIKNNDIKWVYDVSIEPYHTFISNGMILHNTITISKANVQATLRSETSVLAAANPKFGRFDPYQTVASQIDIPPTLINRFDVIFILKDNPDRAKDEAIATHVLLEHQKPEFKAPIEKDLFRKYIAYAKQKVFPKLTNEAVDEIKKFYVDLRNMPVAIEQPTKPLPISARQLEALIRLAEASARSRLSQKVTKKDAKVAIDLMKFYLMQVGYDYETKTFDIDRIATGVSSSQRGRILLVRETLARLESRLGKLIPIEEIKKELEGKIDEKDIEEALDKLTNSGDIFHPRRGFVQRM